MRLDAADLALLEIDAPKLGPLAAGLIQALIDRIREDEERTEEAEKALGMAEDEADDARIHLKNLRGFLGTLPVQADYAADEIENCLDRIREP